MNKQYMRIFTMALLMMVSMGAWADQTIKVNVNGSGEVAVSVAGTPVSLTDGVFAADDLAGKTVMLTVTPSAGSYWENVAVYKTALASTRADWGAGSVNDLIRTSSGMDRSQAATYTFTMPDAVYSGVIVDVTFVQDDPGYSGTYYINTSTDFYLVPGLNCYYNDNEDQPHLTTYKTNKDYNSLWRIVKNGSYYYLIHNATGKYLTANDAKGGSYSVQHLRVHLEASTVPNEDMLFEIASSGNNVVLRSTSKSAIVSGNSYSYLATSNGDKNYYYPENNIAQGMVEFYYNTVANAKKWTFIPAVPTCATPIINYDATAKTFTIDYPISSDAATIYYTIDGSEPTTGSTRYTGSFSETGVSIVRAIAVKEGYANSDVSELYAPNQVFLFKTIDSYNDSYYLVPPIDDSNNTYIYATTSNIPSPKMGWLLKPAEYHNGIQYYYFVNQVTGKYMYCNVERDKGNAVVMKSLGEDGTDAFRYMFRIWKTDGYLHIMPKPFSHYVPSANSKNLLSKTTRTDHNNPIGLLSDSESGLSRWQSIKKPEYPKSLSVVSIASSASNLTYFKLRNAVQTDGNDYYVYPPTTISGYATGNTTGDNPEWYIVPAEDDDEWITYYYFRNGTTGRYLYFDPNANNASNNNNRFFASAEMDDSNKDKYKFIVVKTANQNYTESYHVVPKLQKDNADQRTIALNRDKTTLRTTNSRETNASCWYFDIVNYKCAQPLFNYVSENRKLTITCATEGATIYWNYGTDEPAIDETHKYSGVITLPEGSSTVTAIAIHDADGDDKSSSATFILSEITSGSEITSMDGFYYLSEGFTPPDTPIGTSSHPFRGTIDGQLFPISGLNHPLIGYAENAIIRNVILDNVSISSGISSDDDDNGNTGAIACVAKGTTRIYNCGILATNSTVTTDDDGYTHINTNSSTIYGSNYVGGLVGLLDGEARVINCFSYANITGGSYVGGIVGYNNVATTSANLKTMVMNCMFYGDITGGSDKAPIYNGKIITNRGDQSGVSNFNYFWGGASYVQPTGVNYNCALMAETRFLQRFEFFRHLLNANRSLAAWWATGSMDNRDQMMKWVMEPSQIGSTTPYPILKSPGRYHSVVNIDSYDAESRTSNTIGNTLGTLTVKIQMGSGGAQFGAPTDAEITTSSLTLNITDKDPNHFNFNYGKVQLPYYNDVGTNNYRKASDGTSRVVTGWKIVSITGGTTGNFTTGEDAPAYNFADRNCTNKDLYGTGGSNRIFNQGAYWDVPENVTEITIEPYWAKAAYVSDAYADVVYSKDMKTPYNVPNVGEGARYNNGNEYPINGEQQKVYTTISNALGNGALNPNTSHTPYDYCIVLVGNYHQYNGIDGSKPYTVMSIDLDNDNEPDYSFMLRFDSRTQFHPLRYDFLNLIGLGMAQKSNEGTGSYNFGIAQPIGWFETTNTSLFRVTQFEYDRSDRVAAPLILQGGVIEQWVSGQNNGANKQTTYFLIGGNVWFKEFHIGCHQDSNLPSKHVPVSVTGGDFNIFYLTGAYKANVNVYDDNAECYVNGGRFGMVAGTGMEGLGTSATKGNITWQIDNADITEFYGGGINAAVPAKGNINSTISNSRVGLFCGGPKFGDMTAEKTVTTTATNCTFDTFFGAGYGGNSYSRHAPGNQNNKMNIGWNSWISGEYKQEWNNGDMFKAVSTQFDYQFLPMSGNADNVARIFIDFVKFSLATCRNVTSNLTNCTVTGNFYGGGSLGKVDGPVNSTLTNCKVLGSVFGAGFSASIPTVQVDSIGFRTEPYYYENLGTYRTGVKGKTTTYNWQYREAVNNTATAIDKTNHILYTTEKLDHTNLGTVTGKATLILDGTTVSGNVYGGGDQSTVYNNDVPANAQTEVTIKGGSQITGSVFGGGNEGDVSGSTKVNIQD